MDSWLPNDNRAKKFDFKPCRWTLIYNTTRSGLIIMMLVGRFGTLQSATAVMD
jgi:Holliday junction resolvasome RuvABC ATP-dependent DNA helicase subunit